MALRSGSLLTEKRWPQVIDSPRTHLTRPEPRQSCCCLSFLCRCNLREFNLNYYAYRQKRLAALPQGKLWYLTKVTLPLHNFALVVKYSFRWDNCIEKKLSPVGSQEVLSERKVGYISCKQAFCSKVWNIYRNSPAKVFSFLHLFLYLLHIFNCRSVSKLSLNWGHELLQAAEDFFKRKEIHFENAETWQRGQRTAEICSN